MKTVLIASVLAAVLAVPAQAQSSEPAEGSGVYVGLGVTHAEHEWMSGKRNNAKFFAGYDFSERWGVEAGTSKQGRWSLNYPAGPNGSLGSSTFKGRTSYLAAKLSAPLNDKLALQAKLGLSHNRGDFHLTTSGIPGDYEESSSDNGLYAGVGLKYKLAPRIALSLELERNGKQHNGGPKNEAVSLNASFSF
jgi:OOP family OmpA-OmpF porin